MLAVPPPEGQRMRQQWRLREILALIKLGRLTEAREMMEDLGPLPSAMVPMLEFRLALLARKEGDAATSMAHAEAMDAALTNNAGILAEHRILGHYDLAGLWSQLGEPVKAFPHWVRAHAELARFQPFSRDAFAKFVDATIETFTADRLRDAARATNRDETPVFIVGMPHSGARLIEQILAAHAEMFNTGRRSDPALASLHSIGRRRRNGGGGAARGEPRSK